MPNGFYGKRDEWNRMEAPLIAIDERIAEYADKNCLQVSKNYHNQPERSLVWGDGVRRLIQIYLENETELTFNIWLCVSKDIEMKRYSKDEFYRKNLPAQELNEKLEGFLEKSKAIVDAWQDNDLKFTTDIR